MTFNQKFRYIILFFILFSLMSPIISLNYLVNSSYEREYWPTEEWQYSTPKKQRLDGKLLEDMVEYLDEEKIYVDSIIIVKNGYIVFEDYFIGNYPERKHVQWSVTKSFISALIGIALDKGYLESLDQKALDFFPNISYYNPDPRKENITIENLITMSTGLDWEDDVNYFPMVASANQLEYVFSRPMINDPGSIWNYDTGGTHILSAIIQVVTGKTTLEFAKENLFDPIGISNYSWTQDKQGIYFGGFGLYLTSRDMARFGYLYLNNGSWNNQQIISSEWIKNSTEPYWNFSNGYWGYGYLWWLRPNLNFYSAKGRYEQMIYVLPDEDMVVIFTSNIEPGTYNMDYLIENYILPAIYDKKVTFWFSIIIITIIVLPAIPRIRNILVKKIQEDTIK